MKEEGDTGEIADGNVSWCGSLGGGFQGLYNADREGPHSYWSRILFLVEFQLASQAKVNLPHSVVSGGCQPPQMNIFDRSSGDIARLIDSVWVALTRIEIRHRRVWRKIGGRE